MADAAVRVEGLTALRKALHDIDPQLQKDLRGKFKVAAEKVAAKARAKMPRRTGRAAGSVKAGATASTAYVQTGKATVPYAAWLDFGGTLRPTGMRRGTQVRPRIQEGRYLYPAIKESRADIETAAVDALHETARELGLDQ